MSTELKRNKLKLNRERTEGSVEERLQKVLANAGLGSRRSLEERIGEGEVRVNGAQAEIGSSLRSGDRVEMDGKAYIAVPFDADETQVLIYHKPEAELTTNDDPEGRATIFERLPRLKEGRWIAVGRLDMNTTGILLVTNDGEIANKLMHPSSEIEREYICRVTGPVSEESLEKLRQGVVLEDGPAKCNEVGIISIGDSHSWIRVVLSEGRNREVRRMWEAVGHTVSRLKRIRYGNVELPRSLRRGHTLALEKDVVMKMRRDLELPDRTQSLTLEPVIGLRRAAKSTEFRPTESTAWSGAHADEARELRAFDRVRDDTLGQRPRRGKPPASGARGKPRRVGADGVPFERKPRFGSNDTSTGNTARPERGSRGPRRDGDVRPQRRERGEFAPSDTRSPRNDRTSFAGDQRGPRSDRPARVNFSADRNFNDQRGPRQPRDDRAGFSSQPRGDQRGEQRGDQRGPNAARGQRPERSGFSGERNSADQRGPRGPRNPTTDRSGGASRNYGGERGDRVGGATVFADGSTFSAHNPARRGAPANRDRRPGASNDRTNFRGPRSDTPRGSTPRSDVPHNNPRGPRGSGFRGGPRGGGGRDGGGNR